MRYEDEKDYIMRMIKEMVRVLFSLMLGKHYTQVELPKENKYSVAGTGLDEFRVMVDRGEVNEAENILLDTLDYSDREALAAAVLFYEYVAGTGDTFLEDCPLTQLWNPSLSPAPSAAGETSVSGSIFRTHSANAPNLCWGIFPPPALQAFSSKIR